ESYEEAKRRRMPLIHWLLYNKGIPTKVVMQDATEVEGLAEDYCRTLSLGTVIQFERFGFVRLDSVDDSIITFFYAHR
ncbi:MAG: glutamate--tRNA ligase, partial [Candidatus Bathyarchaeia archaeon]